jgi:hypothetical protein
MFQKQPGTLHLFYIDLDICQIMIDLMKFDLNDSLVIAPMPLVSLSSIRDLHSKSRLPKTARHPA